MKIHKRIVYFVQSDDAIKIGCTKNLERRLSEVESGIRAKVSLIGWIYGTFATELLIHKRLAGHAEGNEWFRDCAEVRSLIQYLIDHGPFFQGLPPR